MVETTFATTCNNCGKHEIGTNTPDSTIIEHHDAVPIGCAQRALGTTLARMKASERMLINASQLSAGFVDAAVRV